MLDRKALECDHFVNVVVTMLVEDENLVLHLTLIGCRQRGWGVGVGSRSVQRSFCQVFGTQHPRADTPLMSQRRSTDEVRTLFRAEHYL